jgi:hypothetical protein
MRHIACLGVVALLDEHQIVVEVHSHDVKVVVSRCVTGDSVFREVHSIYQALEKAHRRSFGFEFPTRAAEFRPVGRLRVLYDVEAVAGQMREKQLETGNNMLVDMAAVVDDDI